MSELINNSGSQNKKMDQQHSVHEANQESSTNRHSRKPNMKYVQANLPVTSKRKDFEVSDSNSDSDSVARGYGRVVWPFWWYNWYAPRSTTLRQTVLRPGRIFSSSSEVSEKMILKIWGEPVYGSFPIILWARQKQLDHNCSENEQLQNYTCQIPCNKNDIIRFHLV